MSNIYYHNIYHNLEDAKNTFERIKQTAIPYDKFALNAIKSIRSKESIEVNWQKIGGELIRILPTNNMKFYKVRSISTIKICQDNIDLGTFEVVGNYNDFEFDYEDLRFKSDSMRSRPQLTKSPYKKHGKVYIELKSEDFEKLNPTESCKLKDEWDDLKIIPAWGEKEELVITSLKQDGQDLTYSKDDSLLKVYGLNVDKPLYVNGLNYKYNVISSGNIKNLKEFFENHYEENNEKYILSNEVPKLDGWEFEEKNPETLHEKLSIEGEDRDSIFKFNSIDSINDLQFIVDNADSIKDNKLNYQSMSFIIEKIIQSASKDELYRIQLVEKGINNDETISKSPLEYFFEDGVDIYEDIPNSRDKISYEILRGTSKNTEFSFILSKKQKKGKKWDPSKVFPQTDTLKLKVNTYQLEKQLEALNVLMNRPLDEQANILKLFKPLKEAKWEDFPVPTLDESKWKVLTDDSRDGSREQRSFVEKAMATSDFMLLEGPPGSGKTTAILELVCQLAAKGKRVLLCGSTHVAIDNVLERLKENNLLDDIIPIRIGDKERISDSIKEFQIQNVLKNTDISEDLILDSANLVCGTTLGILQHPKFKNNKAKKKTVNLNHRNKVHIKDKAIYPEFDYLIIDESSKTTFNEFLVPALFAKKWILVGDVKQLSPYTDREVIESNIRELSVYNKKIPEELQDVCFILNEFCMTNKYSSGNFIILLKKKEIQNLINEVNKKTLNNKKYLIVSNENKSTNENFIVQDVETTKNEGVYLSEKYNGIFITADNLDKLQGYIPEDFLLFRNRNKNNYAFNFKQNYCKDILNDFMIKDRSKPYNGLDIVNYVDRLLKDKNWATEISWRLIREFELKNVKGLKKNSSLKFKKQIDNLLPKSIKGVDENLFLLKQVALPSILESLQRGIDKKEKFHTTTTLTEGFQNINKYPHLKNRFITLKHQHRMHPDISKIPRELFYDNLALKDAQKLERDWSYTRYENRNIWIDHNKEATGSCNREEIKIIMDELQHLFKWKLKTPDEGILTVGILTFYRRQETEIRKRLQKICTKYSKGSQMRKISQFYLEDSNGNEIIKIKLYTVDKFQGQEADVIFLSMVNTKRDGFMDNPNRLNVAITRARYQMVYVGKRKYYQYKSESKELNTIAEKTIKFTKGINI